MNDDDSWEDAAQVALEIHRRVISAVRERVTTGTRKVCSMYSWSYSRNIRVQQKCVLSMYSCLPETNT